MNLTELNTVRDLAALRETCLQAVAICRDPALRLESLMLAAVGNGNGRQQLGFSSVEEAALAMTALATHFAARVDAIDDELQALGITVDVPGVEP